MVSESNLCKAVQLCPDYLPFPLGVNIDCRSHTRRTPLAAACLRDQYECAKLLIENHASLDTNDLSTCSHVDGSPIHVAARHSGVLCLSLLIECSVDVNSVCMGCTPLYEAVSADNLPACKMLLSKGNVFNTFAPFCFVKNTILIIA